MPTASSKPWVHLHVHTQYSLLDGLGSVQQYVEQAAAHGMPALAITDHGGLPGAPEFYTACRKAGIEPIIGEEFYFVDDVNWRPAKGESQPERYHITILAKGADGYKTLAALSTLSHQHFYHKPTIDRSLLETLGDEAGNLVVLSGCAGSRLSRAILDEDMDRAREELLWWRETFPHYYLEMMHHDTDFDRRLNEGLAELGQRYQIPHVITNDPHYVVPEDDCHHDALLAIQTASDIDDPNRFRFDGTGYHLRTRKEMYRAFRQYGDEIWKPGARTTLEVARLCHTRIPSWETRTWQIPKFPDVEDAYKELKRRVRRELRRRGLDSDPAYVEPANHELRVIKQAGIADFLLITADCIEFAWRSGIRVGPGRGSVCGTLVGWLIGLHKIDPIKYNLLFERFLNPARPRMPDIDTDFAKSRRDEMFQYAIDKYGRDNVVAVAAFGTMKMKGAFQTLGKAHGISFEERMRLKDEIHEDEDTGSVVLPSEIAERFPELHAQLTRLMGVKRSVAAHPAGVIIAAPESNVHEQVPEMWVASSKRMVGQFDLEQVEHLGLMKQDFLSLRVLDTISETLALIEANRGEVIDPDEWVPDEEEGDKKVYKMLARGKTAGVFQMEGGTNQRGCRDVKPKNFEDIVSITSLYRTGPIAAGFPDIFINNRHRGEIEYIHPSLEPILNMTWGVILYQEQVMEIGKVCAGFDDTQVDDIKEAIKHKKSALMESMKPVFTRGAKRTVGMSRSDAEQIWGQIEGYSGYSYNRSHAVAYSMLTYQTARLKRFYLQEFTCGLLRTVEPDKDNRPKRQAYLRDLVEDGYEVLVPDINQSDRGALPVVGRRAIRFGFTDLAGIGETMAHRIVSNRPDDGYTSVGEVAAVVRNAKVMQILEDSGALEPLGQPGDIAKAEELLHWVLVDRMRKYRNRFDEIIVTPEKAVDPDDVCIVGEITAITRNRTKTGKDYVTWEVRHSITQVYTVRLWSETSAHWSLPVGSVVLVQGTWEAKWMNISVGAAKKIKVVKRARRIPT